MPSDQIALYLLTLEEGLEVLGPAETEEITHEVRTHLAEAIAEAGGDETAALAGFGSPEELVYRILEERGVTSGAVAPPAPTSLRVTAHVIDVGAWMCASLVLSPVASVLTGLFLWPFHAWDSSAGLTVAAGVWVCLALVFGWFFWIHRRNRYGFQTVGMDAMALRRVSVGAGRLTVRRQDIPGLPKRRVSRTWAIAKAVVLVGILGLVVTNGVATLGRDNRAEADARVSFGIAMSSMASSRVSTLYQMVIARTPADEIEASAFTFQDQRILTDLESRVAAGRLVSYQLGQVYFPEPDQLHEARHSDGYLDVVVTVDEYASGADYTCPHDYHLRLDRAAEDADVVFASVD